jgi:hypothetical protein
MNQLHVGTDPKIILPPGGFLYIDDEVPEAADKYRPKIFDHDHDHINPLEAMTKKKAKRLARLIYTISPQGENTLTVRNGRRNLARALVTAKWLDEVKGDEEVNGVMDDLLFTDEMRKVVCERKKPFTFSAKRKIFARIDRTELDEDDALALVFFLIEEYPGQLIIPDFGTYGRDMHINLIRQNRLIAGVRDLKQLSPKLRQAALLIKEKEAHGATTDDAEVLATYKGLIRGTNEYNDFIAEAIR